MDHKFQSICPLEKRKLLWILGISFVVVILIQSIDLPYGNVPAPSFSAGNLAVGGGTAGIEELPSLSDMPDDKTLPQETNPTATSASNERLDNENGLEDERSVLYNGSMSKGSTGQNNSYAVVELDTGDKKSSFGNFVPTNETIVPHGLNQTNNGYAPEEAKVHDNEENLSQTMPTMGSGSSQVNTKDNTETQVFNGNSISYLISPTPEIAPVVSYPAVTSSTREGANMTSSVLSVSSNTSSTLIDSTAPLQQDEKSNAGNGPSPSGNISPSIPTHHEEDRSLALKSPVITITEMDKLLLRSHSTYRSVKPQWASVVDEELLKAKFQIENAPLEPSSRDLYAPLYRNVSMFKRSYELMEEMLKVYVYKEGQKPIIHQPVLQGIYASEGWFMKLMEANKHFVTKDAKKAHLFYLPFSSRMLEETLYVPNSHSRKNLVQFLKNYLDIIAAKHPFWNRTGGADHFLVACHDWAPAETGRLMARCIRALCNADVKEGFVFGKDVSLPETYVLSARRPLRNLGGKSPSKRSILAFFAGNMHGYVRPILLEHWKEKDPDMRIFGPMPKVKGSMNYIEHMKSSKYCICAKGYEVNSPRVVEAIFYECVPVIISDNFIPPFFETLNWESFAVFVLEKDIPNLKNILLSIPEKRYLRMQMRVKKVQRHFLWHAKPVKYDIFHMILHSIWFNRVFHVNPR